MDGEFYWLQVWLWKKVGGPRVEIMNRKRTGSWRDAHEYVEKFAEDYHADVGPDDIEVE